MAQKLYVCRHGITLWNDLQLSGTPNFRIQDTDNAILHCLMDAGREQARRLGKFLRRELRNAQETYFADTGTARTAETLHIAAQEIPVELNRGINYEQSDKLIEQNPLDTRIQRLVTDASLQHWLLDIITNLEYQELYDLVYAERTREALGVLDGLGKKYDAIAQKRAGKLSEIMNGELMRMLDAHSDCDLVFVGHRTRTQTWLRYYDLPVPAMSGEFCYCYEFEYNSGVFEPKKFTQNSVMW